MTELPLYEQIIRKTISICYRCLLMVFSGYLMAVYPSEFSIYIYFICLISYGLLAYYMIFDKREIHVKLRLILDYSIIAFFLYGKPVDELICTVYLLLPILNTPNFSGIKRSYLLLFSPPFLIYALYSERPVGIYLTFPFLAIFIISLLEYIRTKANNFYYGLIDNITDFYSSTQKVTSEFVVYQELLLKFNSNKFSRLWHLKLIVCIHLRDNNYRIRNSSEFVSEIEIEDYSNLVDRLKKGEVFSNAKIKFNGADSTFNFLFPVKCQNDSLVYIISGERTRHFLNYLPYIRDNLFLKPFLIPFFRRLSDFFASESSYKKSRIEKFQKISHEYEYVLKTINALHFIRNRLSPFNNYLAITSDFYRDKNIPPDTREKLLEVIATENDTARGALKDILERAKHILEKGSNPFNMMDDIKPVEILFVLSELQSLLREGFWGVRLNSEIQVTDLHRQILISNWGINIVFSDIIGNIKKHGSGFNSVTAKIENDKFIITFINSFDSSPAKISKLKDLCRYAASEENSNIFKMKTKGAFLMKDFLKQMNVGHKVRFDPASSTVINELIFNIIKR